MLLSTQPVYIRSADETKLAQATKVEKTISVSFETGDTVLTRVKKIMNAVLTEDAKAVLAEQKAVA
jgi:hypothetical protein